MELQVFPQTKSFFCTICEQEIQEGEAFYHQGDDFFCTDCLHCWAKKFLGRNYHILGEDHGNHDPN